MRKTKWRFFTIADYEEEENWLREQSRQGWQLERMPFPGFYTFTSCPPEDVVYRLDYKNNDDTADYRQMCADYGWEYCGEITGWLYFRKPAAAVEQENDGEIFSDTASRLEMVGHILKTRMLPLFLLLCPLLFNALAGIFRTVFSLCFGTLFLLYLGIFLYCGIKLAIIRRRYSLQ